MVTYMKSEVILPDIKMRAWYSINMNPYHYYTYKDPEAELAFIWSYVIYSLGISKNHTYFMVVI